jgi:hypothetical protein
MAQELSEEYLVSEITRLSKAWYNYVSGDHHKDRDCHFTISRNWSYGAESEYEVTHYGYIADSISAGGFKTEAEALKYLHSQLSAIVLKEEASLRKNIHNSKKQLDGWTLEDLEENEQGLARLLEHLS